MSERKETLEEKLERLTAPGKPHGYATFRV